jgi:acetyl esterase/lipase
MLTEQDPQIVLTMKAIEKKDALLSYNFITTMTELYDIDPSPSNYIAAPLYGDFCGFPPLCVFSGTHDLFFPQIPPFVERVKQAGADCQFIRGEQMMHVWPYIPFSRECASAFEQIIKFVET